jgi:hypothetical protein
MRTVTTKVVIVIAALLAPAIAARAASTTFFTNIGDLAFPIAPPKSNGATPGTIDDMTIGGTTPAPGNFTTLKSSDGLVCTTFAQMGTLASPANAAFFVATRPYKLVSVSEVHSTAAGATETMQVEKDTGTTAPGSGTALLTNNTNAGFNLNATANTVQAGALVGTAASVALAAGDRLALKFTGTATATANLVVTACLAPR